MRERDNTLIHTRVVQKLQAKQRIPKTFNVHLSPLSAIEEEPVASQVASILSVLFPVPILPRTWRSRLRSIRTSNAIVEMEEQANKHFDDTFCPGLSPRGLSSCLASHSHTHIRTRTRTHAHTRTHTHTHTHVAITILCLPNQHIARPVQL